MLLISPLPVNSCWHLLQSGDQSTSAVMTVRTSFPKYQEYFSLTLQGQDPSSPATKGAALSSTIFCCKSLIADTFIDFKQQKCMSASILRKGGNLIRSALCLTRIDDFH